MRSLIRIAAGAAAVMLAIGAASAQGPEGMPQPGPEHKRLDWFVGKWSGKGEMQAGPFGPGGPMTWTETCESLGGFHVVCHSEGKGPMGDVKGVGIVSYDGSEKVYTYYGADNHGWSDLAKGKVDGKTWTYTSELEIEGRSMKSRFVMEETSGTSYKFRWEVSEDGSTWKIMMEGTASR